MACRMTCMGCFKLVHHGTKYSTVQCERVAHRRLPEQRVYTVHSFCPSHIEAIEVFGVDLGLLFELSEPLVEDVGRHYKGIALYRTEGLHVVEQVLAHLPLQTKGRKSSRTINILYCSDTGQQKDCMGSKMFWRICQSTPLSLRSQPMFWSRTAEASYRALQYSTTVLYRSTAVQSLTDTN